MEFCARCDGGAIDAPNCPVCGGSGFIDSAADATPDFTIPSPFSNASKKARLARAANSSRKPAAHNASGLPASEKISEGAARHQSTKAKKHQKGGGNNTATQSIQKGKAAAKKKPANVPMTSRKEQSEKQVVNSALADQLAKLKGNIALAPEKPTKKSKHGKPKKRQKPAPIRQKPISENKKKPRLTLSGAPKNDTEVVSEEPQDHHTKSRVKVSVRNGRLAESCTLSEKSQSRLSSTSWDKRKPGGSSRNFRSDDTPDDSQRQPGNPAIVEQYRQEEDAGRYMGHSFREKGGEYGSLPLYDDHDERDDY